MDGSEMLIKDIALAIRFTHIGEGAGAAIAHASQVRAGPIHLSVALIYWIKNKLRSFINVGAVGSVLCNTEYL
jgi:hypothetical protein